MLDRTKGHPLFYDLLEEMADLHARKNSNYADPKDPLSNLRRCQALGISPLMGILVRLQDKWSRIENLARGVPDEVGESLEDTLMDNAVYSLLAIILIREERNNKHEQNLTEAVNNEIPEEQIKQLLEEIRKRECQSW
jgi:uncharacterized protein YqgQ|uniref:DUF1599 domain-containing protein n=1 Tax=Desulfobacca acetoxidans TaxID=60893 RepID=A0A7C3WP50_9BACT